MSRKNKVIITALLCITSLCVASCSKEKIEPEVSSTQNSSQEETNSSNETSEISIPEFDDDGHKISVITVTNDEGKDIEYEVLFTFDSDETKKNYIVYTDNTLDEEGNTKVYASIYDPEKEDQNLQPIETDEEWDMIENILAELQKAAKPEDE